MFSFLNRNLEQNLYPLVIRKYVRTVQQRAERKKMFVKVPLYKFLPNEDKIISAEIYVWFFIPNSNTHSRIRTFT